MAPQAIVFGVFHTLVDTEHDRQADVVSIADQRRRAAHADASADTFDELSALLLG